MQWFICYTDRIMFGHRLSLYGNNLFMGSFRVFIFISRGISSSHPISNNSLYPDRRQFQWLYYLYRYRDKNFDGKYGKYLSYSNRCIMLWRFDR
jgi:hypothetical protein